MSELAALVEDPSFDAQFLGTLRVTRGDAVVLEASRGVDRGGRPIDEGTPFWLGSIAKPAAAATVLHTLGDRSLDTPVAALIAEWPADALRRDGVDCTVGWLLSHQCGLPREIGDPGDERPFLDAVRDAPLAFVPGTTREYSNVGFALAGIVASRLAERPYCDLVHDLLAAPLGLSHTGCDPARVPDLAERLAPGHLELPWAPARSDRWLGIGWDAPSRVGASGNLFGTADELGAWFRALVRGEILGAEATAALLAPQRDDYGLGVVVEDRRSGRLVWHNGALSPHGYNTFVGYLPEHDTTVVVLVNRGRELVDATRIGLALVDRAAGRPRKSPFRTGVVARSLAGTYGLVWIALPIGAVLATLAVPFRRPRSGKVGIALQVGVGLAMFALVQGMLDRFRGPTVAPVALALALEVAVLGVALWRFGETPLVPEGQGVAVAVSAAVAVGTLGAVGFAVGALPAVVLLVAVAAGVLAADRWWSRRTG